MSNVLKRMQAMQKTKDENVPSSVAQDITDMYLSDLKDKAYKSAASALQNDLVEAASLAELEGAKLKIDAMTIEQETIKELLNQSRSEAAQLIDLVKSLKADVKLKDIAHEDREEISKSSNKSYEARIRELELALVKAESTPAPVIQQAYHETPLPSFEFTPVRGSSGMIESVKATPI